MPRLVSSWKVVGRASLRAAIELGTRCREAGGSAHRQFPLTLASRRVNLTCADDRGVEVWIRSAPARIADRSEGRRACWTYPDLVERSVLRSSHVTGTLLVPFSSFVRAPRGARSFIPAHTSDSPDARRG